VLPGVRVLPLGICAGTLLGEYGLEGRAEGTGSGRISGPPALLTLLRI